MLAVTKVTKNDEIKARKATCVATCLFSGANAEIAPIIIPTLPGLEKLQIAKVAMADDLA